MTKIPNRRGMLLLSSLILFSFSASAQTPVCTVPTASAPLPTLHGEGLTEPVGNVVLNCTGGAIGSTITPSLFLSLSGNITNRLDVNGNPTGISVTVNTGGGAAPVAGLTTRLLGSTVLTFGGLQYVAPAGTTTITISGIDVSIGNPVQNSVNVTALIGASGISLQGSPQVLVGIATPGLLESTNNNGIPCSASVAPATLNFQNLILNSTGYSTIRLTEGSLAAFAPKNGTADTGVRIAVNLTGYGNATTVFVPDAIVGSSGTTPTSAGNYNTATVSAGTYTPGMNQLLLVRVSSPQANGAGGGLVMGIPIAQTTFSTVTQVPLTNGSGTVVYEVVDGNPNLRENAQIPIFVAIPLTSCPSQLTPNITANLAPVSTVSVATLTDPIPRYLFDSPGLDCTVNNDCGAPYFPGPIVNPTSVTLNGSVSGPPVHGSFLAGNTGGGLLLFTESIVYQSGSNWLSYTTTLNFNGTAINLAADPSGLAQGKYQATVIINAGEYGSINVPVTFNVGPAAAQLSVSPTSLSMTASSTGAPAQSSFTVSASNSGSLSFATSIAYQQGMNWLSLSPSSGSGGTTVAVTANPALLAPGVYNATITVNAGNSGSATVAVTFNVGAQGVTIGGIVNSANLQAGPIAAGSYASLFGTGLSGNNVQVTFNGLNATILFDSATQINVLVPSTLGSATTASVIATINGQASNTFTATVAQNAPAVFTPGILNQNNSVNLVNQPAAPGTFVQIFLTGLATPVTSPVTVTIGSQTSIAPVYAGPSSITGVEQVNVKIPATLSFTGNSAPLSVCVAGACSSPVTLFLQNNGF
jgi:uncharacterized protein (TIGR03437 family)